VPRPYPRLRIPFPSHHRRRTDLKALAGAPAARRFKRRSDQSIGTATPIQPPASVVVVSTEPQKKKKGKNKGQSEGGKESFGGESFEAADKVEVVGVSGKPAGRSLLAARGGGSGNAEVVALLGTLGFRGLPAGRL
jgi:hypothetical protein